MQYAIQQTQQNKVPHQPFFSQNFYTRPSLTSNVYFIIAGIIDFGQNGMLDAWRLIFFRMAPAPVWNPVAILRLISKV